jgi:hypothetical protein
MQKKNDTYVCAICGGEYIKGVSEEEAIKEKEEYFGNTPVEECDLVCDDCWNNFIIN